MQQGPNPRRRPGLLSWVIGLSAALVLIVISSRLYSSSERSAPPLMAPALQSPNWLNSPPLSDPQLRGHVVLVEFWTFACANCQNVEPNIKRWHKNYAEQGLIVIGVHSPEFAFEAEPGRLKSYLQQHQISYPIAVDNDFNIWRSFNNWAWPSVYLIDANGRIRYHHVGEGNYRRTESMIQALLTEASAP